MAKFADGAKKPKELKAKVDPGVREALLILSTSVVNSEKEFNTNNGKSHVSKQSSFYIYRGGIWIKCWKEEKDYGVISVWESELHIQQQ